MASSGFTTLKLLQLARSRLAIPTHSHKRCFPRAVRQLPRTMSLTPAGLSLTDGERTTSPVGGMAGTGGEDPFDAKLEGAGITLPLLSEHRRWRMVHSRSRGQLGCPFYFGGPGWG